MFRYSSNLIAANMTPNSAYRKIDDASWYRPLAIITSENTQNSISTERIPATATAPVSAMRAARTRARRPIAIVTGARSLAFLYSRMSLPS